FYPVDLREATDLDDQVAHGSEPSQARPAPHAATRGAALRSLEGREAGDHLVVRTELAGEDRGHLGVAAVGDAGADSDLAQLVLLLVLPTVEDVDGLPGLPPALTLSTRPRARAAASTVRGTGPCIAASALALALALPLLRLRTEPESRVGHAQHVVRRGHLDGDIGGHAGTQLEVGVGHLDDHRIGDDVLVDRGVQPDLGDL